MILRLTRFWTLIWIKRCPRAWFFQAAAELGLPGIVSKRGVSRSPHTKPARLVECPAAPCNNPFVAAQLTMHQNAVGYRIIVERT